jgi:septal ring factor EnvC (AmiA/AmiB activator)
LIVALKRVKGDGEETKAERHRLEDRAAKVKAHLNELNRQLEELEATHRERREDKE